MAKEKNTYSELDEIRQDLDSLKGNVVELTKHLKKDGVEKSHEVGAIAREQLDHLKTLGIREMHKVENQIKTKPGQSLAVAFAAGALASLLLRGRA